MMKGSPEFGKKLKDLRLKKDMSLRDLGELSGISYSFINSIENGRYKPSKETVISLAEALGYDNQDELLLLAGYAPQERIFTVDQTVKFVADILNEQGINLEGESSPLPDWATSKDKRDAKDFFQQQEVMFDGVPMSDVDKAKVLGFMENMFWEAKKMNKRKKKSTDEEKD